MKYIISTLCLFSPFIMQAEECTLAVCSVNDSSEALWQKLDLGFDLLGSQNYETAALTFEALIQDCYQNPLELDLSIMLGAVLGELIAIDHLGQADSFYRELGKVIMSFGSQIIIEQQKNVSSDNEECFDPMEDVFTNTKISKDLLQKYFENCKELNFRKFAEAMMSD